MPTATTLQISQTTVVVVLSVHVCAPIAPPVPAKIQKTRKIKKDFTSTAVPRRDV